MLLLCCPASNHTALSFRTSVPVVVRIENSANDFLPRLKFRLILLIAGFGYKSKVIPISFPSLIPFNPLPKRTALPEKKVSFTDINDFRISNTGVLWTPSYQ
jgi:hypothetical protein